MLRKTIDSLAKHPLNSSKTKQSHSFSKQKRFKTNTTLTQTEYIPISFEKQLNTSSFIKKSFSHSKTNFGKQKRFWKEEKRKINQSLTPSPNSYRINCTSQQKSKSPTFGKYKKSFNQNSKAKEYPGPGSYFHSNPETEANVKDENISQLRNLLRNGKSFTKARRKSIFDVENNNPGPGTYNGDFSQFSEKSQKIISRLLNL